MNSTKFNLNQLISMIFIFLGFGLLVFGIRVGVSSFSESLIIDESVASAQGIVLQKGAIKKAVEIISQASYEESEESSSSAFLELDGLKENTYPKKVEIISNNIENPLIEEIKNIIGEEGTEFSIKEQKEGLDESRVIYKNEYSDLKVKIVDFLISKEIELKVFKRQEEKEFDMTIELVNNGL